jgi:hypothetical protein
MITLGAQTQVYLAAGATDMRKQIDGLAALVVDELAGDPFSSQVFVFCNRARDKLKILVWHHNGFWPRTACTARPATSRIQVRTSTGWYRKEETAPTIPICRRHRIWLAADVSCQSGTPASGSAASRLLAQR